MRNRSDRPLGKILHVVDNEAITRPISHFRAPNSKVVLETMEEIGVLGEPFGPSDRPFQAIKLSKTAEPSIIGKLAFAQIISKRSRKRRGRE